MIVLSDIFSVSIHFFRVFFPSFFLVSNNKYNWLRQQGLLACLPETKIMMYDYFVLNWLFNQFISGVVMATLLKLFISDFVNVA